MGEYANTVLPEVRDHLSKLARTAGLEDSEESLELLAEGWLEKQSVFHEQTKANEMEETDLLELESGRGALILTYSGSLLTIGPDTEDGRTVEYASIGLRQDVPEFLKTEKSVLKTDVNEGVPVEFEVGPIKSSSPVFAIAVVSDELDEEAESELLGQVTVMVAEDFVEVNKTLIDGEA